MIGQIVEVESLGNARVVAGRVAGVVLVAIAALLLRVHVPFGRYGALHRVEVTVAPWRKTLKQHGPSEQL